MKKFGLLLILVVGLILTPISQTRAEVTPQKVTATSGPVDTAIGVLEYTLRFWNVGSQSGSEYAEVIVDVRCSSSEGDWGCDSEEVITVNGTFSGGPNGHFSVNGVEFDLINGRQTTVYDAGYSVVFTVNNPEAFDGWGETKKDEYVTLPTTENKSVVKPGDKLDFSFPKITKVIGEVQTSDPSQRSGLVESVYRSWRGDAEPWRKWESGAKNQQMQHQSIIKTGLGRAIIEFNDGSKIVLDRDSTISFNYAGFSINNGSGTFSYKKYGSKFVLTGRRVKFGIVGTEVSWEADGDDLVFNVIEGEVEAEALETGETMTIKSGDQVQLDDNGDLIKSKFDINQEVKKWEGVEAEAEAIGEPSADTDGQSSVPIWIWVIIPLIGLVILVVVITVIIVIVKMAGGKKRAANTVASAPNETTTMPSDNETAKKEISPSAKTMTEADTTPPADVTNDESDNAEDMG